MIKKYKKETVLPINAHPIIETYSDTADYLSIISNSPYYNEWLCSNIFHLLYTCNERHDGNDHVLRLCYPDFTTSIMTFYEEFHWQDKIKNEIELFNYLKDRLNNNYYCVIVLNKKYVPDSLNYKNNDYLHRVMLYGYSDYNSCFYLMGHNKSKKYAGCQISFNELNSGFFSVSNDCPILLFKLNEKTSYEYDWNNILCNFRLYNEKKVERIKDETNYFNFEAMKQVKNLFIDMKDGKIEYKDSRIMASLKEHKNVIMNLLKTLNDKNVIFEDKDLLKKYSEICDISKICESLFLKYMLTNNRNLIDKINENIDFIIEQEKKLFPQIIKGLENYINLIHWSESNGFNERRYIIEKIKKNNNFFPPDISCKTVNSIKNILASCINNQTEYNYSYHEYKIYTWEDDRLINRIRISKVEYIIITYSDGSSEIVKAINKFDDFNDICFNEKSVKWIRFDFYSNNKFSSDDLKVYIYEVDLAFHKPVVASSTWKTKQGNTDQKFTPDKVVDGNENTFWNAEDKTGAGEYLEINIGESIPYNCIVLSQRCDTDRIMGYKLLCSDDSQVWDELYEHNGELIGFQQIYHHFETVKKSRIRLLITKTLANEEGYTEPGIRKFEVYYYD